MAHITLIGAPTDIGASLRGAGMGPEALRVARLPEALAQLGHTVHDAGNLSGPANPQCPPDGGFRHLSECTAWNAAVADAVAAALRAGQLPMLLGGDHSLAVGSIGAVAAHCQAQGRRLRVIWLDAHADFNTCDITPSGNLHGMPVAVLCGHGPEPLLHVVGQPALSPEQFRLIGVRSVDPLERAFVHAHGLDVFDMRYIDEVGMRAVMQQALMGVDDDTHVHLSFDVDFLDPDVAPGVGTPVRGGPTWREAQLCMEMLADTGCVGSVDIVELNPAHDVRNRSAECVVELIESLFGKSTLLRCRT
mgnify:FL=1